MPKNLSLAEAKATLSECIREVERGEPVVITRHGKPVAAIVTANDLDQVLRLRAASPKAGLASLIGKLKDADDFLAQIDAHKRSGSRATPDLE